MGTLERLQKSIAEYLRSLSDLRFADVYAQLLDFEEAGKAEGMKIRVLLPMPLKASKYAIGPTFSDVEITIEITRDTYIAMNQPTILTASEIVSRALHRWSPPIESGFSTLVLAENKPWQKIDSNNINITFKTQSVLQ